MHNKISRFLIFDAQLRGRILILLAAVAVIFIELKMVGGQGNALNRAKGEQALVLTIPDMEKTKRDSTIVTEEQTGLVKVVLRLDGVTVTEGVPYALIDGVVYAVGDLIGNYIVVEISVDQGGRAILKEKDTQEIKTLLVPQMK